MAAVAPAKAPCRQATEARTLSGSPTQSNNSKVDPMANCSRDLLPISNSFRDNRNKDSRRASHSRGESLRTNRGFPRRLST